MWKKYVTRRLAVQVAQMWNAAWGEAMEEVYHTSLRNTLVYRDAHKTEYYVDEAQLEEYTRDLRALLKRPSFLKRFHRDARKTLESILKDVTIALAGKLSALTNRDLLELYTMRILPQTTRFYIRMWTVFNIADLVLADEVFDRLKKIVPDASVQAEYLLSLSSPLQPNDAMSERIDLLRLAEARRVSQKSFSHAAQKHAAAYAHIPLFDFDHEPYTIEHFQQELRAVRNPKKELAALHRQFSERKKEYRATVLAIRRDKRLGRLVAFLRENVFLRDYRDMLRQKLNLELRKLYTEIGNRIGLTVRQVALLTNDEIVSQLRSGTQFSKIEIKKRERAYLLIQKGRKIVLYSGSTALRVARKELAIEKSIRTKELKGVIGSRGVARGIAKIIFTNMDLHKVREGDVLIATMTRQDFVPAIRRAAALVTDEGSVICHAAIIAREFGIPCVLATKTATRVIKDGDRVEVNAEKGVVRVLHGEK